MTEAQSKRLRKGDRVIWDGNSRDLGTVIEVNFRAVKVKWDDPSNGEVSLMYHTEMADTARVEEA